MPQRSNMYLAGLLILSLGLSAVTAQDATPGATNAGDTPTVSGDRLLFSYRGFVSPNKQEDLIMPLEGMIQSVPVKEGDHVKKEQVLAKIDDRVQQVVVESARTRSESLAELERTKLVLKQAELKLGRVKKTFKQGAATALEVQEAELEVGQAQAGKAAAEEAIELAKVNLKLEQERLKMYELKAPFDGRVIRTHREAGATVTSTDIVVTLTDLSVLKAVINLPSQHYGSMKIGKTYKFQAGAPFNKRLLGKLKTIDPIIDTASQTFRCVFEIDNKKGDLPAGFMVYLLPLSEQGK